MWVMMNLWRGLSMSSQNKYAPVAILVNIAGIIRDNLLMRMKPEEWNSVIYTNLTSLYRLSKSVVRGMMKATTVCIINIASVVGSSGNAGQTSYSAAKAGMLSFTRSVAAELGSWGITVNAVAPGFIRGFAWQNSVGAPGTTTGNCANSDFSCFRCGGLC